MTAQLGAQILLVIILGGLTIAIMCNEFWRMVFGAVIGVFGGLTFIFWLFKVASGEVVFT